MAKHILLDEFHLTVAAPQGLEEAEYLAIQRVLDGKRFQTKLRVPSGPSSDNRRTFARRG